MNLPVEGMLVLRRRSSWEAADAGLLLWRANFVYFLPFFALPVWLCAFGLRLLPEKLQPWSWLMLWYLKPLFDRLVLQVISVRFFEPAAGAGRLFRGLGKTILRGLPGDLLWRRFSPRRSAVMPLRVLEKLRGRNMGKRKRDLEKGGLSFCGFLTLWAFVLEVLLFLGEVFFIILMINIIQPDYISSFGDFFIKSEIFFFAVWCFNAILVESIYVCMGFGLYVNSRVEVEGWDIEILLRKLTDVRKKKRILPAALAVFFLAGLILPFRAYADGSGEPGAAGPPLETLEQIFASEEFGGEKEGWGIRWKNREENQERDWELPDFEAASWIQKIRQVFAFTLRLILVLGICGLGFVCIRYLYTNRRGKPALRESWNMTGLFDSSGPDPEALLEKARAFYGEGDLRRAWGCCLAALFEAWSRYRRPAFPPDATEYGCLALVRAAGAASGETAAFASVVTRWAAFAYGGRTPPAESFEAALAFCRSLIPGPPRSAPAEKSPEAAGVR
jgi:hypothetical protein